MRTLGCVRPGKWLTASALCAGTIIVGSSINWFDATRTLAPLDLTQAARGSQIVTDRNGVLLRAFTTQDGRWRLPITTADVDPRFFALLKSYEDRRFEHHRGVDWRALLRAALQFAASGHIASGGSTLTMQVARLLEPREERSLAAKVRQIARALELESRLSKREILDLYLALAPYGGNLEGVRAASLAYFGKEPRRLSFGEAALLVALPQSPEMRRPDRGAGAARAARDRVLDRAVANNVLTPAEAALAKSEPVPHLRLAFPVLAPHAAETALRLAPDTRVHELNIDAKWQQTLEALARDSVQRVGAKASAAILVVDNATGEVRAHVGAADYFSAERGGGIDMVEALRSPGSALKPFIYALAFENGVAHPETMLDDRPSRWGVWQPENFDLAYQGAVTARRALQMSLNVPAIELLDQIGPARFLARLRNAGAEIVLSDDSAPGLAVGLGGLGIRLGDLARLYAGLARGGDALPLIEEAGLAPKSARRPIAEPLAAWYVGDILRGAPPPQNAPAGRIAYKTGTSYGYRDAIAVGYDRRHTIAVWAGRPDNASVPGLVGRFVAAPILFDAFARIGIDPELPPKPRDALVARSSALPPPLRHLRQDAPKVLASANSAPLRIAFPPNGARVDLGLTRSDASALALKAQGGVPPLTWIVNGAPLGAPDLRRQANWAADGAGFAQVSVIDAKGATDSVTVRVE
ncbi:MAG: penicillin-binding protein 1C [Methylobacteriaceae bacterium]|nr:penicillin-binding protein 1C [Methylobacteriaceae bacterium]